MSFWRGDVILSIVNLEVFKYDKKIFNPRGNFFFNKISLWKLNAISAQNSKFGRKWIDIFAFAQYRSKIAKKHCFTTRFFPRITRLWVNYEQSESWKRSTDYIRFEKLKISFYRTSRNIICVQKTLTCIDYGNYWRHAGPAFGWILILSTISMTQLCWTF